MCSYELLARSPARRQNRAVPAAARPLILAYHAVSSTWDSPLAVTEEALDHQAAYLRGRGYRGLTMAEAERLRASGGLPPRSVVFTFDDGYRSTLRAAAILGRHGYAGTVFAVTAFPGSGRQLSWEGIEHELTAATAVELEPLEAEVFEPVLAKKPQRSRRHSTTSSFAGAPVQCERRSSRAARSPLAGAP